MENEAQKQVRQLEMRLEAQGKRERLENGWYFASGDHIDSIRDE